MAEQSSPQPPALKELPLSSVLTTTSRKNGFNQTTVGGAMGCTERIGQERICIATSA